MNIARGLGKLGHYVQVCTLSAEDSCKRELASHGVGLRSASKRIDSRLNQFRTITGSRALFRDLAKVTVESGSSDWYVILADEALGVVTYLGGKRVAYIVQGDLDMMFLNPAFYETESLSKRWLARSVVARILRRREWAQMCDVLLANSQYARRSMPFVLNLPVQGVVYPPVDIDTFKPAPATEVGNYAVAFVRNVRGQNLDLLASVASRSKLKIVGGGRIPGAEPLGILYGDDLARVLSRAQVLISPRLFETFGYPILESLSCGTPALTFDGAGPTELVENERNGWLVSSKQEFLRVAQFASAGAYPVSIRAEARRRAEGFSIAEMTSKLVSFLT
jgi:glycosyltransferase involved in cell wall biosynthesis